jgi:circadian clock protein KaiB
MEDVQYFPETLENKNDKWILRFYVAGQTPKYIAAIMNLKKICEVELKGKYTIEIIDLLENPHLSKQDQIMAIPVLVEKLPIPVRKIISELSATGRILIGLDIKHCDNELSFENQSI